LERLRSSAYEAFKVSCMRNIEGDLASVRAFLRLPVMNICRRQERNAARRCSLLYQAKNDEQNTRAAARFGDVAGNSG